MQFQLEAEEGMLMITLAVQSSKEEHSRKTMTALAMAQIEHCRSMEFRRHRRWEIRFISRI